MKTLIFIFFIQIHAFSQTHFWKSERGMPLIECDTFKSKPKEYLDYFLIDSTNNFPYTGLAICRTNISIDSVNFDNGMKSGLSKETYTREKGNYTFTNYLDYGYILNRYQLNKQKKVVFFIRTKGINYNYTVKFKKNNIVMKVKLSFDNKKKECFKIHFNEYENYHNYFKTSIDDNLYLKMVESSCFINHD